MCVIASLIITCVCLKKCDRIILCCFCITTVMGKLFVQRELTLSPGPLRLHWVGLAAEPQAASS